ncbi:hypothetical protein SAMN02745671_02515 [Anaerovibrio lipolyticus DSM 3074]|uniref:RiboL-PSP-HEPN domain-containing protein n=1 Tax=Anaerovibrio lipolyticus DSM 3074 TaxID=1120997 RepID=A0A1M6G4A4_9FIRM|nr:hypothetical protein [Anaerovibrio lipolyticus]SHJ04753.1 hypothetical protein SAMN02745671_02515 [Anaerovibrio lipolyticus DSM 3074]
MSANISKEALIFQNRIISFKEDLELIDVICNANKNGDFLVTKDALFRYVAPRHTELQKRRPVKNSREIVIKHLRKTVYSSYIKDLYEELTAYLKSIIYQGALISKESGAAHRLLGEHKIQVAAHDILQFSTLKELIMKIAEDIIQKLEAERSTAELIKKVCNKLGLKLPGDVIENALPFLEIRHILVHADGKVNKDFNEKYPDFKKDSKGRINLNYDLIMEATEKVTRLVNEIDKEALGKNILKPNTPK